MSIQSSDAMRALLVDVAAFHAAMGLPADPHEPTIPEASVLKLRARLIIEEVFETLRGMYGQDSFVQSEKDLLSVLDVAHEMRGSSHCDLVAVADGLDDSIYVEVGTALSLGIPLDRVWTAVQVSNMSKCGGERRADGKIGKGPNFQPARVREAVYGDIEAAE